MASPAEVQPTVGVYRRRAVVVGINYTTCGEIALKGCANDAYAFALTLVNLWHFDPRDILLLTDDPNEYQPGPVGEQIQKQMPYRNNILLGLKWLTGGVHPGDVLVFYFAGHGLQLDNLSGWEGEGFDDAILPLDCTHQHGDVNAITAVCLKNHFLAVSERIQLSIFLDCAGNQSALDVCGSGRWNFIKGVVQKGIWPLTDPTNKMQRAKFDPKVWKSPVMKAKDVRPRYVPGIEVNDTNELSDVVSRFKKCGGEKTHAFMIAGAPFSEVPVEALCPSLRIRAADPAGKLSLDSITTKTKLTHHGAFTWALIKALTDTAQDNKTRRVTFTQLQKRVTFYMKELQTKYGLTKMNQQPSLTHYRASGSDPNCDCLFYPFGGRVSTITYHHGTTQATLKRSYENRVRKVQPSDFMNTTHLDAAMKAYSSRLSFHVFAQKQTQELDLAWKSPVARSTIM